SYPSKTEPHTSVYGHISVTGRVNLDLADFVDEFPEVKLKTLESFADYLGVMKISERILISDIDVADYWNNAEKRKFLKKFSSENVQCIMGIAEAILDFAIQLSNLTCLPLDHVGTAAAGFRVEWFMIKQTRNTGELIPRRVEQPYRPYTGAIVLKPEAGIHGDVAVLDFKSMYPTIMIKYNLSPDTYVLEKEPVPAEEVYETPEVKHRFRKEPAGFYKNALLYLIAVRDDIRSEMGKVPVGSGEYRVLDARQKAVKVIANASYGYAGWIGARWYVKPVAEAATAWGRYIIANTIEIARKTGLKVIYGDTDSIFVKNEPQKICWIMAEIAQKLGLEIKLDKVYTRVFFTEAKKRYAGLLPEGQLEIVGLEVIRGDWATIARNVQEKVLETVLKDNSPEKAVKIVQLFIRKLRQKQCPYRDLVIWKTLTKPAEEYAVKTSHVEAAKMLRKAGWELTVGDKVGYVVVTGSGRLYERVKPHVFASYDEVDVEYYVNRQVVPAAVRILESFGITEEQLLESKTVQKETRSLTEFF
ncbi:DNA polymerase II, partial [Candidatus Bathyarchaeota archaeon]|nr:DNA polymerase II [Candidatus Bathyarchaeota archaeon]